MIKSVLNRAHRAISTSKVFAHESLVEVESVSMRRYGISSIVHKNPVALAIGRFRERGTVMSLQRLHAFEKTSIQARHSIKRLEMLIETTRFEEERVIAKQLLEKFREIRRIIPDEFQDVDLKEKE